jgi:hypothetical protein
MPAHGVVFRDPKIPGIRVLTPANSPNFSTLVKNHLGHGPTGVAAVEMRWAMRLVNDSGKQIVSMTTAWTVDCGEPSSIYAGTYPFRRGRFIEPGSTTLVLPQFVFGAGAYVPTAEEVGSVFRSLSVTCRPPATSRYG